MKPITKILVPFDFSPHSKEALHFAIDLSRRYEASLQLLHVFQMPTYALPEGYVIPSPDQIAKVLTELRLQLTAAKDEALAQGVQRVETTLLKGGATSEIVRVARESACDLIVMGTHGRTGVKHLLIGSVAENIVRSAHCPVLTVRAQVESKKAVLS